MRRLRQTPYFETPPDAPPPLEVETSRVVRFEEVDSVRIVWHGRFPSFFEDARAAFGKKYNLGYLDMYNQGFLAPIVQLHFDYYAPLTFPEEFTIKARSVWSEAAKINFEYEICGPENRLVATGFSVQLLTDLNFQQLMVTPPFLEKFRIRWKEGALP